MKRGAVVEAILDELFKSSNHLRSEIRIKLDNNSAVTFSFDNCYFGIRYRLNTFLNPRV